MSGFRVYKANKQGTGTASEWQLSFKSQEKFSPWKLFFSIAKQLKKDEKGNPRFDWDNAICVKMDVTDISEIIAVLENRQKEAGYGGKIFHKHGNENKIINFIHNPEHDNFFIKVSHQSQKGVIALQQNLTIAEGCALRILLQHALLKLTNWGYSSMRKNYAPKTMPGVPRSAQEQPPFQQAI
jgi:hypothetical protein